MTLESLVKDKELKSTIKDLIRGSGRSYPPTGEIEVQELTFLISPKFGIVFVFPILVHSFRKTLKTCLNFKPSWGPGKKF